MTNQRKAIFVPVFLILMGTIALSNAASKPGFDAIRAIDLVRLIAVGMCFGAAIVTFVMFLRGRSSN